MSIKSSVMTAALMSCLIVVVTAPAAALTMKECSAKYEAAKTSGTLGGQKWNDFRKAQCGSSAAVTPAPAPAAPPSPTLAPKTTAATPPAPRPAAAPEAAPMPVGNAVFPSAISPKYATQSAGKARMHTCLDQYNANKASNANGGLKWIQKGGGYYSECNKRLKG